MDILEAKDYWYRFELQHRGRPHAHGLAWFSEALAVEQLLASNVNLDNLMDATVATEFHSSCLASWLASTSPAQCGAWAAKVVMSCGKLITVTVLSVWQAIDGHDWHHCRNQHHLCLTEKSIMQIHCFVLMFVLPLVYCDRF